MIAQFLPSVDYGDVQFPDRVPKFLGLMYMQKVQNFLINVATILPYCRFFSSYLPCISRKSIASKLRSFLNSIAIKTVYTAVLQTLLLF